MLSTLHKYVIAATLAIVGAALSGCDSLIYDDQGDCDPYYKVKFVYDYNMKFADAFAVEVNEVTLYVVDAATGKVVWQKHEAGPALQSGSYAMDVDVPPGTYTLLAWCGSGHTSSFAVNEHDDHTELHCRLTDRQAPEGFLAGENSHVRNRILDLYHGKLDAQVFPDEQGVHQYEVHLTKDTNHINVHLQHLSGEPIEPDDFTYTITEANGHLNYDNSIRADEDLTYFPWEVASGAASIITPEMQGSRDGEGLPHHSAVAYFTTSRLMANRKATLRIYNSKQEKVADLPLTDYLKLSRQHNETLPRPLTDQEYLDYQDQYNVTLLLDENGRWSNATVYVESWRIIIQNTEQ